MIVVPDPEHVTALQHAARFFPGVFLYIGPDQIMPLASVLGAIVGVALMFWNRLVSLAHKCLAIFGRRPDSPHKSPAE